MGCIKHTLSLLLHAPDWRLDYLLDQARWGVDMGERAELFLVVLSLQQPHHTPRIMLLLLYG